MKPVLRAVVALAAAAFLIVTTALPTSARPTTVSDTGRNFADPGLVWTGNGYALYGTGAGSPAASAEGYSDTFRTQGASLPVASLPGWVGINPDWGGRRLWAPSVVKVGSEYVMYYTAWHGAQGRNCIRDRHVLDGLRPVHPRGTAICAPTGAGGGAKAIDPSAYVSAKGGICYMLFKTSLGNASAWKIWAEPMGRDCPHLRRGGQGQDQCGPQDGGAERGAPRRSRLALRVPQRLQVVRLRRRSVARGLAVGGRVPGLRTVRVILNQANTGKCGPGGATVLNLPGSGTRIAFHAWDRGTPSSDVRSAFTAIVGWSSTGWPYVD